VFAKIDTAEKKGVRVAGQLLRLLRDGTLREGDRLPTEREMMEQLGVSRTVLREALSALQLAGHLGSRPGYGHFVKTLPAAEPSAWRSDILQAGLSVVEAIEARAALDLSVVCLAIHNATPDDLGRADRIVEKMIDALEDAEFRKYALLTLELHELLAESTGNSYLHRSVVGLIELVRESIWVVARNYDPAKGAYSLDVHRQMVDGIREKNLQRAVDAVLVHYQDYPGLRES
jgi:GntR family transcriptional repressor for pyruvate dehydrogenase complex